MAPLADLDAACGSEPTTVCQWVFDVTDSDGAAEVADWAAGTPLRVLLIVLAWFVASRLARRWIDRSVDRFVGAHLDEERQAAQASSSFSPVEGKAVNRLLEFQGRSERARQRALTLGSVLKSVATISIAALAVLMILGEFDIDLGPLIAGAGILGIALGFGAQSLVKDFLAGMFIVFEDQYGVGDYVDLGEATGQVEDVFLRTTRVRDINGALWVVPNGEIHRVANQSQLWARSVLDIDVAYDTDIDRAMEVLYEVADEIYQEQDASTTILEPPEVAGVQQFGDSAVTIRLTVKTEPSEQWATARVLRRRIKLAFDEQGIEMPFPQRVVHVADDQPEADRS